MSATGRVDRAASTIVVTGTDTGVGKTVVSAAICSAVGAAYAKPAQSGTDDGDDDAAEVARLTGAATAVGIRLGEPLAPAVAARRAGVAVGRADLLRPVSRLQEDRTSPIVVEGAGGVLVELGTDGTTIADMATELGAGVVVVARPGLGTLNHTLLTLEACDRRNLDVIGVVVSGMPPDPDVATATNLAELDRLTGGRLAGVVPWLPSPTALATETVRPWLAARLGGTWQLDDQPDGDEGRDD